MNKLFLPFRNKNFVFLFITNLLTILYIFLTIAYFAFRKYVHIDGNDYGSDSVNNVLITGATCIFLSLILFLFALSRIRSWVIFLLHCIIVLVGVILFNIFIKDGEPDLFDRGVFLSGLSTGVIFYFIIFGPSVWFLFRFRSTLVPILAYSFFFIGSALLSNHTQKFEQGFGIKFDILISVFIFFAFLGLILYFENLLKFARELNKPAFVVRKNFIGKILLLLLIIIPALISLIIGVNRAKFHQRQAEKEKLEEELKKKEEELRKKQRELERKRETRSEGEKIEDPYGNPFEISSQDKILFEVTADKSYTSDLVLRALSYSFWDEQKQEFSFDKSAEKIYLESEKVFELPEIYSQNTINEINLSYQFTKDFNYKVVPHLLTAIECADQPFFYKQSDYILSDSNLLNIRDLKIKSQYINQNAKFFYQYDENRIKNFDKLYLTAPTDADIDELQTDKPRYLNDKSDLNYYSNAVSNIYNYIIQNYKYNPNLEDLTTKKSINYYEFLFKTYEGNSLNFAEAFTILLRKEGIPARVVTGYVSENRTYTQSIFSFKESDKLFWTEVYFPGVGWINYFPIGSKVERQALKNESQKKQKEEYEDSVPKTYKNGEGRNDFRPLTEDEIEKLNDQQKEDYEKILEEQKELEKQQEEKKQEELKKEEDKKKKNERLKRIFKIIVIIFLVFIGILLISYLLIYPAVRFILFKNKLRKTTDPYPKIITSYKLIIYIYSWFGLTSYKTLTPTEVIKKIEEKFNVNLNDLGWIYNRAVLREKLNDSDVSNAMKAFDEVWYDRFDKNFNFKSILFFYRFGRFIKKK